MELALIRIANLDHFHQIATLLDDLRTGKAALPPPTIKPVQRAIAPPQREPMTVSPQRSRVALADMTDARAKSVWFDTADSIDGMLGSMAMQGKGIRFEKPNVFVATFDSKTSKEFCERESARLQGELSRSVGEAVKVRFELDAPEESVPVQRTPSSHQADREQYLAAAENPLVLKIQEVFAVSLEKVER